MITQKRLKELLHYNSITGLFTWNMDRRCCVHAGDVAGTKTKAGYIQIRIDKNSYLAHRLAWFYVHGVWPVEIDHKDTVKDHNWIKNLRDVAHSKNMQNQIKAMANNKSTGVLGVTFIEKRNKYQVEIMVNGKRKFLGRFSTLKIAKGVYLKAKSKLSA